LLFLSFSLFFNEVTVSSNNFGWFCLAIASMFSVHKLCHALPLIATKKQVKFRWKLKSFFPYVIIQTKKPFSKIQSYIVFLAPFVISYDFPKLLSLFCYANCSEHGTLFS
jgi:hypothetical protein